MHQLSNGYTLKRVPEPHLVNGEPSHIFRDATDRTIVIADPGDPELFMSRVAEAIEDCFVAVGLLEARREVENENRIDILYDLFHRGDHHPKIPLIPDAEPRLPFDAALVS